MGRLDCRAALAMTLRDDEFPFLTPPFQLILQGKGMGNVTPCHLFCEKTGQKYDNQLRENNMHLKNQYPNRIQTVLNRAQTRANRIQNVAKRHQNVHKRCFIVTLSA